jgi:Transposase DDE domain
MARWRRVDQFVERSCASFRKSQRTTISALLVGLLRKQQIGLASIARGMQDDTSVKHRVKRAGRFCQNEGVDIWEGTRCLARYLLRRKGQNVIAIDWTDLGDYMLLKASLIFQNRALPLAWHHVWKWVYDKSQNDEEEQFIERLAQAIGDRPWVLLADAGFGRTELFRRLNGWGIDYVIRVNGRAWIEHQWYTGPIDNIPRRPGRGRMYCRVAYRKQRPVTVNLAIKHKEPAPAPWYLVTNLDRPACQIANLYAQRMGIEEGIRDCKTGLGLKTLWLGTPDRMDRAMLLVALALLLIALTAAASQARGEDLKLSNNKRGVRVLSYFSLGIRIIEQYPRRIAIDRRLLSRF